jgi:hypothetical protein
VRVTQAHSATGNAAAKRRRGNSAAARRARGRALGRQKKYDASVSSRHVNVTHPVHPTHPVRARTHTRPARKPKASPASHGSSNNGKKP